MTNLSAAPTNSQPPAKGDEAQLFSDLNARLIWAVRRAVNASDALCEDACSFAWIQLLRRQPDREHIYAWLRTTAIREAWTLARSERRTVSLDEAIDASETQAPIQAPELLATVEARDALRAVSGLRPLHRRTFARFVAGLSYEEIAAETNQTARQVERHIRRARSTLRAG